jgi:hypothetical protein
MRKYFLLLFITVATSATSSFGQTIRSKTDDLKNDPKTVENAAKADAGLINKKNITDSSLAEKAITQTKEPRCRCKRKNKSTHRSL